MLDVRQWLDVAVQRIPPHELKIDRCFITSMQSSHSNKAIVQAVLQLAHAHGLEVVAEGVEDGQTESALSDMGCDITQGYHLSRPLPAPDATAWIAAHPGARSRSDPLTNGYPEGA